MLRLEAIAAALHLPDPDRLAPERWVDSMASLQDWDRVYGDPRCRQGWGEYLQLDDRVMQHAERALLHIVGIPEARALLWHAMRIMRLHHRGITGWPALDAALGRDAGMFYLLALLPLAEDANRIHRERQIPLAVVQATMADFMRSVAHYERTHDAPGLHAAYAGGWLRTHLQGRLYRLGRLQVVLKRVGDRHLVYRHARTGQYQAFVSPTHEYRYDGYPDGDGPPTSDTDPEMLDITGSGVDHLGLLAGRSGSVRSRSATTILRPPWQPTWEAGAHHLTAHPVNPYLGTVARDPVSIDLPPWTPWLNPGSPVFDLHIPDDGPLDLDACRQSLDDAVAFFARHFPEYEAVAFYCESWLLDPQLAQYLPPTSNIVRFQNQFLRLALASDGWSGLRHVFDLEIPLGDRSGPNLDELPRDTTLQRALADHLRGGGRWRKFGGVLPIPIASWAQADKPWAAI